MNTQGITPADERTKNTAVVLLIFISVILFQLTTFKFIWNIEVLARLVNIAILAWASAYFSYAIVRRRFNYNVYLYYIVPGLMIYWGFFANLVVNSILNISVINRFGLLLPWAIYLAVPQLMNRKALNSEGLWRLYYYFMFVAVIVSVAEYIMVFYGPPGLLALHSIGTSGGRFLAAWFSVFHALEDGSVYYRIYACFPEPGTLAMYLLPAISYAFFHKRRIAFILFVGVLIFTDSLGGYVSLFILFMIFLYMSFSAKAVGRLFVLLLMVFAASIFLVNFSDGLLDRYEQKQDSRIERESNFTRFIDKLPYLIVNYPLGFTLAEDTEAAASNQDYSGSNFTPGNAFMIGGVMAFCGYLSVLLVSASFSVKSLFRQNISIEEKVVSSSVIALLPFIFQRAVVWDGALFAFLFAPVIIRSLQSRRI